MEEPVWLHHEAPPRFQNEELAFLEKHLFRAERKSFEKAVSHLHLTVCRNPEEEAEYILHQVERLVRTKGYRYRDFAILTGNVEEYASAFRRKAEILQIPLFEDVKKRVSYHSGVETLRALLHLAAADYSYESVFRYLKSGMSDFTDEETDTLENYVILGGHPRVFHVEEAVCAKDEPRGGESGRASAGPQGEVAAGDGRVYTDPQEQTAHRPGKNGGALCGHVPAAL